MSGDYTAGQGSEKEFPRESNRGLADEAKRLADELERQATLAARGTSSQIYDRERKRTELHAAIDALRDLAIPAGEAVAWRVSHPVSGDIFRDTEPDSGVYPPSYTVTPLYASPQPTPKASQDGGARPALCSMGVGCDEAGVCYADAHGDPSRCPRSPLPGRESTATIGHVKRSEWESLSPEAQAKLNQITGEGSRALALEQAQASQDMRGKTLGRESTAQAGAGEDFPWPTMPPSRGQSHVLFEDGYAEGWAKCLDQCKEALHGAHQGSQGIIKGLTDYIAEKEAAAPNVLAMREALQGLLGACAKDGWWLKAEVVREMDAARAALASTLPEPRAGEAGDDVLLRFLCDLHANLPEAVRPMGWSDFSDEQAARARKAWARALAASPIVTPKPQEGREPPCDHRKHLLTGYEKGYYTAWCGACGLLTHQEDARTPGLKDSHEFSDWVVQNVAAYGCGREANSGKGGVYGKEKTGPCKVWCGSTSCAMTLKRAHGIVPQDGDRGEGRPQLTYTLTREQITALSVEITHRKRTGDWMDAPLDAVKAMLGPAHTQIHSEDFDAMDRQFHWGSTQDGGAS